jgi:hypothetical protein
MKMSFEINNLMVNQNKPPRIVTIRRVQKQISYSLGIDTTGLYSLYCNHKQSHKSQSYLAELFSLLSLDNTNY